MVGSIRDNTYRSLGLDRLAGSDSEQCARGEAPGMPLVVLSGESDPGVVRTAIEIGADQRTVTAPHTQAAGKTSKSY